MGKFQNEQFLAGEEILEMMGNWIEKNQLKFSTSIIGHPLKNNTNIIKKQKKLFKSNCYGVKITVSAN